MVVPYFFSIICTFKGSKKNYPTGKLDLLTADANKYFIMWAPNYNYASYLSTNSSSKAVQFPAAEDLGFLDIILLVNV